MIKLKNQRGIKTVRDDQDIGFSNCARTGYVLDTSNKTFGINIVPLETDTEDGPDLIQLAVSYGENPALIVYTRKSGKWIRIGSVDLS